MCRTKGYQMGYNDKQENLSAFVVRTFKYSNQNKHTTNKKGLQWDKEERP